MRRLSSVTLSLALLVPGMAATPLNAADYAVVAPVVAYSICNEHKVLTEIVDRFDHAEKNLLRNGLAINDFSGIMLNRYEPTDEKRLVERTYCHGYANLNDSRARRVWYLVEHDMGFATIGDKVEFCIDGLDPLNAYGADCQSLR